ncbi:MAG: hypothetical protein V4736_12640 [Bdellovibrionota bacterium]
MKTLLTLTLMSLISSTGFAAQKVYTYKYKDRVTKQMVFETTETASSESEAFKKAAHKCMDRLQDYSTDDALDICVNPRS